jgi:hypothetical protein
MRKGDLVKLSPAVVHLAGERLWTSYSAYRPTTVAEQTAWYESDASKGLDSAGESKLPPQAVRVEVPFNAVLVVERARCRVRLGWGNPTPGMAKVMLPTGETAYIAREKLVLV